MNNKKSSAVLKHILLFPVGLALKVYFIVSTMAHGLRSLFSSPAPEPQLVPVVVSSKRKYIRMSATVLVLCGIILCLPFLATTAKSAEVPIDGGLTFLAASGIAYGTKKISANRKRKLLK